MQWIFLLIVPTAVFVIAVMQVCTPLNVISLVQKISQKHLVGSVFSARFSPKNLVLMARQLNWQSTSLVMKRLSVRFRLGPPIWFHNTTYRQITGRPRFSYTMKVMDISPIVDLRRFMRDQLSWLEHMPYKHGVSGSNPLFRTMWPQFSWQNTRLWLWLSRIRVPPVTPGQSAHSKRERNMTSFLSTFWRIKSGYSDSGYNTCSPDFFIKAS